MTIKGYPDRKKRADGAPNFATVAPVREQQFGLDVTAHVFAQVIATDAAEADSTTTSIVATSHVAQVGDVISFTSGNLDKNEYRVASVSANAIGTVEEMSEAPAAADTFKILRQKVPVLNSDGEQTIAASLNQDEDWGAVGATTLRVAAVMGNETDVADFNSGAAGAQTLRTVLATRHEAVATPVAAQLSNGSAAVAYDSGAAGATVLRTVLATRHEAAATPVATRDGNGTDFAAYGSDATSSATPRVVTASRAKVELDTHDHSSGNVTAAAYTELIASTSAAINRIYISDTSGEPLIVAVGAASSEVDQLYLGPGHAGWIDLHIPASSRVSIKSLGSTTTAGTLIFTGLS